LLHFLANLLLKETYSLKNREMHIQFAEPVNDPANEISKKGSEKITKSSEKSSEKIIQLIKTNAHITIKELAEQLNISTRAVEKNISKLKAENRVERIGSDKGGHWKVIEK
jgi:predicted HTH transcriptional regulator